MPSAPVPPAPASAGSGRSVLGPFRVRPDPTSANGRSLSVRRGSAWRQLDYGNSGKNEATGP
ncbi:hypothetical protein EAO72_20635 [Streptomyces sp. or43]|nr:hypothetical protein EAO72_20635 [Streptomyces sp. or43]